MKTDLIVALDLSTRQEAERLVQELEGLPVVFKVGYQLFYREGFSFVKRLTDQGKRVFLDIKMHDIPNTVIEGARQAVEMGVEMFTIHTLGGEKMCRGVLEMVQSSDRPETRVLGVTALTSHSLEDWNSFGHFFGQPGQLSSAQEAVSVMVKTSVGWGMKSFVCSPHEAQALKEIHSDLYLVTPGVRPKGAPKGDQSRVMTPAEASQAGASAMVVGRPIYQPQGEQSSRDVAESILSEI